MENNTFVQKLEVLIYRDTSKFLRNQCWNLSGFHIFINTLHKVNNFCNTIAKNRQSIKGSENPDW